jgi:hypothetical protein
MTPGLAFGNARAGFGLLSAIFVAALLPVLAAAIPAQAAQKVGVAAAVNPDAFAGGQVINLGKSLFFNQRVNTSANGLVQVLLVDGSTFTVGPNSNLVIDKFVYDPAKGQGEMVATFSKGALRFVGGKLSKKEGGVTVKTPQGALAIRGGIAQLQVNAGGSKFLFDFGDRMQLFGNDGQTHTIFQPGNTIDATGGGNPFVRPTSAEDIRFFLTQLASKPGQSGGAGSGGGPSDGETQSGMGGQGAGANTPPPVGNNEIQTEIFTVKIEDATSDEITREIVDFFNQPPPPPPVVVVDPPVVDNPPPPPPPVDIFSINLRVLNAGLKFTSFTAGEGFDPDSRSFSNFGQCEGQCDNRPGAFGILGGDEGVTNDDFVTDALIVEGSLQDGTLGAIFGVASGLTEYDPSGENAVMASPRFFTLSFNSAFGDHAAAGVTFSVDAHISSYAELANVPAENIQLESVAIGSQVYRPGFLAYQLYPVATEAQPAPGDIPAVGDQIGGIDFDDPLLIIAGEEFVLPTGGQVREISLRTDPRENQGGVIPGDLGFVVPFASAKYMPKNIPFPIPASFDPQTGSPADLPQPDEIPAVSALLLLERDGGSEDVSQSVWLQTSFYISPNGQGGEQQSFAVIALGGVEERNGFDALVGMRRGGSQIMFGPVADPGMRQVSFAGGVATLAAGGEEGGLGAHLLGEQEFDRVNLVIGADSTHVDPETGQGHEIFIDRPLVSAQQTPADDHQYATYHIGTQITPDQSAQAPVQTDAGVENPLLGYAVGVVNTLTLQDPNVVMNSLSSDVSFAFDAETNTLAASFRVLDWNGTDGAVSAYDLKFGGIGEPGRSAFIDDRRFAAIETPDATAVLNNYGDPYETVTAESWLASGDQLQVTNFFPSVFEETGEGSGIRPFCANCDFIRWGAWGTRVQFGSSTPAYDDNVHNGWWVAGDVTTISRKQDRGI